MKIAFILLAAVAVGALAVLIVWVYVVQNVATPEYRLIEGKGRFEVRKYPALTVAEIERDGPRRQALSAGFGPLAGYIFARDRDGPKIAMTAPVTQRSDGHDARWSVGFIMPDGASPADLPRPENSAIRLTTWPERTLAAIRFSGHPDDGDLADREAELRAWLSERGHDAASDPLFAYYNDPFTPGFLRRNEVLLEILAQ